MTNRQIRKQSYKKYIHNVGLFLGVAILSSIPSWLNLAINNTATQSWRHIITSSVTVAGYPLLLGVTGFFYKQFHGESSSVSEVLCYYKIKKPSNAFLLGAIITGIRFAFNRITGYFRELTAQEPVWIWLFLIVSLLQIYIFFRLFLAPYLYIATSETNPSSIIRNSFRKTKGFFVDKCIFDISVLFTPVLFTLAVIAIVANMFNNILLLSVTWLYVTMLFLPYIDLCMAGFAAKLLPGQPKLKKPSRISCHNKKYRYKTSWVN